MSKHDDSTKERLLISIVQENAGVVTQITTNFFNVIVENQISGYASKEQEDPVSSDFKGGRRVLW